MQKNYFNPQDQRQVFICDQQAIYAMGCGQLVKVHPMCNGYRMLTSLDEINNLKIGLSQGLLIIDCAMFDFDSSAVKNRIKTLKQIFPLIILLNKDIMKVNESDLLNTTVHGTWINGKRVFQQ